MSSFQPPGPGDPLVDSYTVNVSSTDGQRLCGSQTTEGNSIFVVLDVTGCVMCQGSNKTYAITVEASNRGGQTTANPLLCKRLLVICSAYDVIIEFKQMCAYTCTVDCTKN